MHPLDGFEKNKNDDYTAMRVGFFIKAVPAIFLSELDNWRIRIFGDQALAKNEVFLMTASNETEYQDLESLIIFNYEVSPFAVMFTNA